jgi:hypothetical protein
MRNCRQRIWYGKHKVQVLLVPHLEPATPIVLALRNEGPIICDALLIPAIEKSCIDLVPLDIPDEPDVDTSDPMWESKHTHGLLHANIVGFEGAQGFRCGFDWIKYQSFPNLSEE